MASTHKSLRSSTANKRPTTSIADGQIALNTNAASPGLFFKDSAGTDIIKVGPVHVGTTAPNATPATGGSSGNSTGEVWLDTSLTPVGVKIWNGSAWVNATPTGSTTVQGLLELATNAETQTGTDTARAVTPAGLQSKLSDSTSTTSSTTIASSTAVKSAYDLANAALPKTGGVVTGALEIGTTGSLVFEGATDDGFETTLAVADPSADRIITLPDRTGTVITNADTGTVTSTMIADGTIVNADVNASAAIAGTKISPNFGAQILVVDTNVLYVDATTDRVGIGTSSPEEILHIKGPSETPADRDGVMLQHSTAASTADTGLPIVWSGYASASLTNYGFASICGRKENNTDGNAAGYLQFATGSSGGAISEKVRIDSSGNVGIGTSSPDQILDLQRAATGSAAGPFLRFTDSYAGGWTANTDSSGIEFYSADTSGPGIGVRSKIANTVEDTSGAAQALTFWTTGNTSGQALTERVRIDSDGNLGIGTTNISTYGGDVNIVKGAVNGETTLVLANNSQDQFARIGIKTNEMQLAYDTGDSFVIGATTTSATSGITHERMRIDSSGRLLCGTTTTSGIFRTIVQGNSSTPTSEGVMMISRGSNNPGANGGIGFLDFGDSSHGTAAGIGVYNDGTWTSGSSQPTRMVFTTTAQGASSPTERMRIDSSGRLLAGATISGCNDKLTVQAGGISGSTGRLGIRNANATSGLSAGGILGVINFGSRATEGHDFAAIRADVDATPTSGSSYPGRLMLYTTASGGTSPTERMRIDSAGNITNCLGIYNNTTASAANVFVGAAGDLGRSTSSIKYKTNVETIEDLYSDALLNCRPVWYRSTCKSDNPDYGYWGFIAEEVAEIDPRLVLWKTTNPVVQENGSIEHVPCEPEPEGVAYDRFVPHLLNLIKRQQQAIKTLEQRLTDAGL